jgi:hypothetical protein
LNQTGTHLTGFGYDTRVACSGTFNDHILHIESQGCYIDNLRIDGTSQTGSSNHGIYVEGTRAHIMHVRVEDCSGDGIHIGHSSWVGVMGGKIHHNTVTGNSGHGIYIDYDATDWEIFDCLLSQHDGTGDAGMVIDGSSNMISFCHFWGNYYNIILAPAHHVYRTRLVSNGIMDNDYHGIYKNSAYNFRDSVITGNNFWANSYSSPYNHSDSIYFAGSGNIRCVTITANAFYGYKEDVSQQCTRYAINDASGNMDYCTIGFNTFDRYYMADPTNVASANNVEDHNTVYMCG